MVIVFLVLLALLSKFNVQGNVENADHTHGGCGKPNPPENGKVEHSHHKCVALCNPGYKYADGTKNVTLECSNGKWYVYGKVWTGQYPCTKDTIGRRSGGSKGPESQKFCKEKLEDKRFAGCKDKFNLTSILINACSWSFCYCNQEKPEDCACDSIASYVSYCAEHGGPALTNWRDKNFCPIKCTGGRVPTNCAPKEERQCGSAPTADKTQCTEGCVCPEGSVIYKDKCIKEDKCPCLYGGKTYQNDKKVTQGCNNCVCKKGNWDCKPFKCDSATCTAIGDPHYKTFDGTYFNFQGNCSYHIVETNDFDIIGENVPWKGGGYVAYEPGLPTCTKSVTIKARGLEIKLDQGPTVFVDGQPIKTFPYTISGISISQPSTSSIVVVLPSGTTITWDGMYSVSITVPPIYAGKTKGLCGNFNDKPGDDFTKPDGAKAKDENDFGNSWKTLESCPNTTTPPDPCAKNPKNKQSAETECKKLKSDTFKACHNLVNPDKYYDNCIYDSCACGEDISKCLCSIVASYANDCKSKGVVIDWRKDFALCPMKCAAGQEYQVCAQPCDRTCLAISAGGTCAAQCVEDCRCPQGQTFDGNGTCIPLDKCGCPNDGRIYPNGREVIRSGQICTCTNAMWICDDNTCKVEDEKVQIDCNSCICKNGQWTSCTNEKCPDGCEVKNQGGQTQVLKDGENWNDGPCRSCTCANDPKTGYRLNCVTQTCPPPNLDRVNYAYKNETKPGECCPTFTAIACIYNNTQYTENQSWVISKCKRGICVKNANGQFSKREITQSCQNTKCDAGYKLEDSDNVCCPRCKQYACIIEDGIKNVNETWQSADGCITYNCNYVGGQYVVFSNQEICPDVSQCPKNDIVSEGCCDTCSTAQTRSKHKQRHSKHIKSHYKHD